MPTGIPEPTLLAPTGVAPVDNGAQAAITGQGGEVKHLPFSWRPNFDPNVERPPDYFLYIYTVAKKRHSRDAYFPVRKPPLYPCLIFPKCEKDEPFRLLAKIPNIVNHRWTDDQGEMRNTAFPGERVATDICNPLNLTTDIWQEVSDDRAWLDGGGTDDLTRRGVFWSRYDPPRPEELARARERMERHYRSCITVAEEMHARNEDRWIPPECHEAADHFAMDTPWHRRARADATCPNCGEPIRDGIAFHRGPFGLCVIDRQRTVAALGEAAVAHIPVAAAVVAPAPERKPRQ